VEFLHKKIARNIFQSLSSFINSQEILFIRLWQFHNDNMRQERERVLLRIAN
jgi:hypothetical protein